MLLDLLLRNQKVGFKSSPTGGLAQGVEWLALVLEG